MCSQCKWSGSRRRTRKSAKSCMWRMHMLASGCVPPAQQRCFDGAFFFSSPHQQQKAVAREHGRNDDHHHEPVDPQTQLCEAVPDNRTKEGSAGLQWRSRRKKRREDSGLSVMNLAQTMCVCKYACSCDYSPVNLIIVIEGNQTDVYPAQGKQGNQNDQCKPTTCTLWRQNTVVFKRLKLQVDSNERLLRPVW